MPVPAWVYIGGGSLIAGALAGWTVRDWKSDSDQLAALEKSQKEERRLNGELLNQSRAYEGERADAQRQLGERRQEIRTIYRDRPVPADCAVPDDVRGVLVRSVEAANARAAGQPDSAVPTAAAPPRTDERRGPR